MRNSLLLVAIALVFGAFAVLLSQPTEVRSLGASTDNSTTPNSLTFDQSQDEIKPLVNSVLLGPSAQPEDTPPSFIAAFMGTSEQDKFKVTGNETWSLDLDINTPGWLYIYEYYPPGEALEGKWIAYKWQLLQSGLWRLGPFTPGTDESEGQHVYRIWFYSDGQWAEQDPNNPQSNFVYWTYSKGQPAEQPTPQIPPQPPPTPAKEATFLDWLRALITNPMALVIGCSSIIVIALGGLYMYWRHTKRHRGQFPASLPSEAKPEDSSAVSAQVIASAKIVLPNNMELKVVGNSKIIGRGELARSLDLDQLGLISRQHFKIKSENEQFYIEDLRSSNGTRLNGADISSKGPVSLGNDDIIEPAGAIRLKFQVL